MREPSEAAIEMVAEAISCGGGRVPAEEYREAAIIVLRNCYAVDFGAAAPAAGTQPSEEAMAAYEQAAKWCEERAEKMRKWAKGMSDTESRQARYDHAEWVQGCADTIRHNAEKMRAAAPAQRQEGQ